MASYRSYLLLFSCSLLQDMHASHACRRFLAYYCFLQVEALALPELWTHMDIHEDGEEECSALVGDTYGSFCATMHILPMYKLGPVKYLR